MMNEGPKVAIREIEFERQQGGQRRDAAEADEVEQAGVAVLLHHRARHVPGSQVRGRRREDRRVLPNQGYIAARVGQPELKYLEDAPDGKTRYVQLEIAGQEGGRYKVGDFKFDGNKVVKSEGLRPLFKLNEGEFYSEKRIRKGLESAREVYGPVGYWEFTGFPDLKPRDQVDPNAPAEEKPVGPVKTADGAADRGRDDAHAGRRAVLRQPGQLRRQHHHPRQRGAPRGPAARGWRLQHRGA